MMNIVNANDLNGTGSERFRGPALVDFGGDAAGRGRRLERLGGVLVDRPCPQATGPRRQPDTWAKATAVFVAGPADRADAGGRGGWKFREPLPEPWQVELALGRQRICLEVRPAPSGQLGIFLEQWPHWTWLAQATPAGCRMLSLFGHSGAATLAVAAAGAEVVHVDASRQACDLARRNAAASQLDQAAIRWICDDARRFVTREVRRGSRYDGVILDPPSWGHGPKGEAFSIDRDLAPLLDDLARLLPPPGAADRRGPVLLTCHSPRWHHRRLHDTLADTLGLDAIEAGRLTCTDAAGRSLALGDYARHAPARSHDHT